jgi:hypothetical protein
MQMNPETESQDIKQDIQAEVKKMIEILGEKEPHPMRQIRLIAEHAGLEFAQALLQETLEIEKNGGMLTHDATRKRTLGGIFFLLAKAKLPEDIRQEVFPKIFPSGTKHNIEISEISSVVQSLYANETPNQMTMLPRATLVGRVNRYEIKDHTVVLDFKYQFSKIGFTRGIPPMPVTELSFVVLTSDKQWENVRQRIMKNSTEEVVVDGTFIWHDELKSVVLFATLVTSREQMKKVPEHFRSPMISGDEDTDVILPARPVDVKQEKQRLIQMSESGKSADQKAPKTGQKKPAKGEKSANTKVTAPKQNNVKPNKPASQPEPKRPLTVNLPQNVPAPVASDDKVGKLQQLEQAAATLRERVANMEAKKQPGVAMTKKLLESTEKQIEALKRGN